MKNKLTFGLVLLILISSVSALELNLLEEQPEYKITIEGTNIDKIVIETSQEEINQFIQDSKDLNRLEKFNHFIKTFQIPYDFIMKLVGGYFDGE